MKKPVKKMKPQIMWATVRKANDDCFHIFKYHSDAKEMRADTVFPKEWRITKVKITEV